MLKVAEAIGRIALSAACIYGVYQLIEFSPMVGFAGFTAVLTLIMAAQLEWRRFFIERRFFFGGRVSKLGAPFIVLVIMLSAFGRAFAVGAAALFTFPAPAAFEELAMDTSAADKDFFEAFANRLYNDLNWTIYAFAVTIIAGVALTAVINIVTINRGPRWSFYQFVALFGIGFSVLMLWLAHDGPDPDSVLSRLAKRAGLEISNLLQPVDEDGISKILDRAQFAKSTQVILPRADENLIKVRCQLLIRSDTNVPGGRRGPASNMTIDDLNLNEAARAQVEQYLTDDRSPAVFWTENQCGYRVTPEYCDGLRKPDGTYKSGFDMFLEYGAIDFFADTEDDFRNMGCFPPPTIDPAEVVARSASEKNTPPLSFTQLLAVISVLDGYVDEQIKLAIERLLIRGYNPFSLLDEDQLSGDGQDDYETELSLGQQRTLVVASVFISSRLLQGLVIATYVTLLMTLLSGRTKRES